MSGDRDGQEFECQAKHCPPRADGRCDWPECAGISSDEADENA